MLNQPRQQSLVLSMGSVLDTVWPSMGADFPGGATTALYIYDFAGTLIQTFTGTVTAKQISYFITDLTALDAIPSGAKYELFVTTGDGPYKWEFGNVVRREHAVYVLPTRSI
jgi:hypothetical protein